MNGRFASTNESVLRAKMRAVTLVLLSVSLFCAARHSRGYNILGICPSASYSHQQPFQALMRALAARGHNVTVASTIPLKVRPISAHSSCPLTLYSSWNRRERCAVVLSKHCARDRIQKLSRRRGKKFRTRLGDAGVLFQRPNECRLSREASSRISRRDNRSQDIISVSAVSETHGREILHTVFIARNGRLRKLSPTKPHCARRRIGLLQHVRAGARGYFQVPINFATSTSKSTASIFFGSSAAHFIVSLNQNVTAQLTRDVLPGFSLRPN